MCNLIKERVYKTDVKKDNLGKVTIDTLMI